MPFLSMFIAIALLIATPLAIVGLVHDVGFREAAVIVLEFFERRGSNYLLRCLYLGSVVMSLFLLNWWAEGKMPDYPGNTYVALFVSGVFMLSALTMRSALNYRTKAPAPSRIPPAPPSIRLV